jgi:hypothetical protein
MKKNYILNFLNFLNNKIFIKKYIVNYIYGQGVLYVYYNFLITNYYVNKIFKKSLLLPLFCKNSNKLDVNMNSLTYLNKDLFKLSKQIVNLEDIISSNGNKSIVKPLINIADINYY